MGMMYADWQVCNLAARNLRRRGARSSNCITPERKGIKSPSRWPNVPLYPPSPKAGVTTACPCSTKNIEWNLFRLLFEGAPFTPALCSIYYDDDDVRKHSVKSLFALRGTASATFRQRKQEQIHSSSDCLLDIATNSTYHPNSTTIDSNTCSRPHLHSGLSTFTPLFGLSSLNPAEVSLLNSPDTGECITQVRSPRAQATQSAITPGSRRRMFDGEVNVEDKDGYLPGQVADCS